MKQVQNFSKYLIDEEKGTVYSLRTDKYIGVKTNGYINVSVTNDDGVRFDFGIHRFIFMSVYGNIPDGYEVHHIDENPMNNAIDNLRLIEGSEHLSLHKKGKILSEETKKKMHKFSKGNKINLGKHHTETTKKKISETKKEAKLIGKDAKDSVPILQLDINNNLIKEWDSLADAQRCGFSAGNICSCCKGLRKTHKGFIF